jgi:multicomponent K+:H+ antiporter subunit D
VLLTVQAAPVFDYLGRASAAIHRPALYIERVLGTRPVPAPVAAPGHGGAP